MICLSASKQGVKNRVKADVVIIKSNKKVFRSEDFRKGTSFGKFISDGGGAY